MLLVSPDWITSYSNLFITARTHRKSTITLLLDNLITVNRPLSTFRLQNQSHKHVRRLTLKLQRLLVAFYCKSLVVIFEPVLNDFDRVAQILARYNHEPFLWYEIADVPDHCYLDFPRWKCMTWVRKTSWLLIWILFFTGKMCPFDKFKRQKKRKKKLLILVIQIHIFTKFKREHNFQTKKNTLTRPVFRFSCVAR